MAKTYYVSGKGTDRNNGLSKQLPFRTLQKAADRTRPGDTVYVMNGNYSRVNSFANILTIRNSGAPGKWITYKAYPGDKPKLKSHNWNAIEVKGASYIIIDGFELEGNNNNITLASALALKDDTNNPFTSGNGIGIVGSGDELKTASKHIIIRNNDIYNFGGGGIYTSPSDYITIENNRVHSNAWYSPYGNSGISARGENSDDKTGYKLIIRGNTVYDNKELIPWFEAQAITDGNGIIIDTSRNTDQKVKGGAYSAKTLIENNIVFNNGGRGIGTFFSDRIDIKNNTTYQNSQSPTIKDGEISVTDSTNVRVFNNILYAAPGLPANTVLNSSKVIYNYNLIFGTTQFTGKPRQNRFGQDPLFVDPASGNFSLQANSPALEAGGRLAARRDFYGNQRPQNVRVDIGAIEQNGNRQNGNRQTRSRHLTHQAKTLLENPQEDSVSGTDKDDRLIGRFGNDTLLGGTGSDRLVGREGNDKLTGGKGKDVFVFQPGDGQDILQNFQDRQDKIELAKGLQFSNLSIEPQGHNAVIRLNHQDWIWLKGVAANRLTATDFIEGSRQFPR